jgi:hypothetical protein
VQVLPLSQKGVAVAGVQAHGLTPLRDGDELSVGRARFTLEVASSASVARWLLAIGERRYPVDKGVFRVGGDVADDLVIDAWPAGACLLHATHHTLVAEASDACAVRDAVFEDGSFRLRQGSRVASGGVELMVTQADEAGPTIDEGLLPCDVVLELMPHGALLSTEVDMRRTVFLPRKRAELVAALLSPGAGGGPGDWIDDEVLMARVWGSESATRTQLNVLVHRTRQSLTEAGLNGLLLVARAPGGGSTRFRIAAGARVSVV